MIFEESQIEKNNFSSKGNITFWASNSKALVMILIKFFHYKSQVIQIISLLR
jgi:hypothetical protein